MFISVLLTLTINSVCLPTYNLIINTFFVIVITDAICDGGTYIDSSYVRTIIYVRKSINEP